MRSLIFFLLISGSLSAQVRVEGKVVDNSSGLPIAHASIGLLLQNTGTSTDQQGNFELHVREESDTLIVSCIGYHTVRLPVSVSGGSMVLRLEKKYSLLREVVVKDQWKKLQLGETKGCGSIGIVSGGYQVEMAQPFTAGVRGALLKEVQLCMKIPFFSPRRYRFRLRIYDVDPGGRPGEDLSDQVIEVVTRGRQEKIDLSDHQIRIPGEKFFVSVQWLFIPANEQLFSTEEHRTYGPVLGVKKVIRQILPGCFLITGSGSG